MGMATVGNMMAKVVKAKVKKSDPVSKVMYKQFKMVNIVPFFRFEKDKKRKKTALYFVLIVNEKQQSTDDNIVYIIVYGIWTFFNSMHTLMPALGIPISSQWSAVQTQTSLLVISVLAY